MGSQQSKNSRAVIMECGAAAERSNEEEEEEEEVAEAGLGRRVWEESKKLWRVGGPAVIISFSTFGSFVATQSFIGRCGETELASYALVFSTFFRFSHGLLLGMGSATETLCGQAFGAKRYSTMGIYLQRSWVVIGGVATLLLPFFIFASPVLKALGQSKDLADAARPIALQYIPTHCAYVFSTSMQLYLQSQLKNQIIAWLALPSFFLHLLISWLAVIKFKWAVTGAMTSLSVYGWSLVIGQFIYITCGGCPQTWTGFSRKAFTELWPMIKLSLSSGIMICLYVWYNAILVFMAGYMKNAKIDVAALSICVNVAALGMMVSMGVLTATSVRVANQLGKGNAKGAKFAIKVAAMNSCIIGCFFLVLYLSVGKKISYAFTSSRDVAKSVSSMYVLLVLSALPPITQSVLAGTAIGSGYQSVIAYVNVGCYYVIGLPLALVLGYMTNLHVKGMWLGALCGLAVQTFVVTCITIRTDWDKQVEKAKARLNRWSLPSQDAGHDTSP